jgi:hypothetical protein
MPSGLSAAALAEAVQVGPERVDEAGELVAKSGLKHQAQDLIEAVGLSNPPELVAAMTRAEDTGRTKFLHDGEIERATRAIVGDDCERILKGRVRGPKGKPERAKVVVLFELPSGRTARCAFPYANCTRSQALYEGALSRGEVDLAEKKPGEDDHAALKRQNDRLAAEVERLSKGASASIDDALAEQEDDPEELKARIAELEAELAQAPAGTEDAKGGEPHDSSTAPSESTGGSSPEPPGVAEADGGGNPDGGGNAEVEVPSGAKEIIAAVETFSDEQIADLCKDGRSTVAKAAKAERKRRKEG